MISYKKCRNRNHLGVQQDNGFVNHDFRAAVRNDSHRNTGNVFHTTLKGGKVRNQNWVLLLQFCKSYTCFRKEFLLSSKRLTVCFSFQRDQRLLTPTYPLQPKTTKLAVMCWAHFMKSSQYAPKQSITLILKVRGPLQGHTVRFQPDVCPQISSDLSQGEKNCIRMDSTHPHFRSFFVFADDYKTKDSSLRAGSRHPQVAAGLREGMVCMSGQERWNLPHGLLPIIVPYRAFVNVRSKSLLMIMRCHEI